MSKKRRRAAGSVFRRKRSAGGYYDGWYVRYTDAFATRRLEYGGRSKDTAEAYLRERLTEKDHARLTGQRPVEDVTFADFAPELLAHWKQALRPTTYNGRKGLVRDFGEAFKGVAMTRITTGDVQRFLDHARESRDLKPATIRQHAAIISAAFKYAITQRVARENPCQGLHLPRIQRVQRPYLTDEQRRHVYAHMPEEIRTCVILLGDAGLRRSEAVDLTWDCIGQAFDYVAITQSKNGKTRIVPLTQRAGEALRAHATRSNVRNIRGLSPVFDFNATKLNVLFKEGARAAGMPNLTPHVLRHAFASGLVRAGVDLPAVARLLGHADIQMAAHYSQWAPENASQLAIRKFEQANEAGALRAAEV